MMRILLVIGMIAGATQTFAAPMKDKNFDGVKMALQLPLENRIRALKLQGPAYFKRLQEIAKSESETMEVRWRAITAMGRMQPVAAQPILDEFLQSEKWFLRNASAVVLHYGDRTWAVNWAKKLLKDKALVVRTGAVEALKKMNAIEAEQDLWAALYSEDNFKGGKSLWIRKHIAETLSSFAHPGQQRAFIKILRDEDRRLHPFALKALTKLSKNDFTRDQWLSTVQ